LRAYKPREDRDHQKCHVELAARQADPTPTT